MRSYLFDFSGGQMVSITKTTLIPSNSWRFPKLSGCFIDCQTPVDLLQEWLKDPKLYFVQGGYGGSGFTFLDFWGAYSFII